jgi:K+-transporting ATPase ATPase C chain
MSAHLRANLWLLVLTLLLCSAAYPAVLWALGRVAFSHQAEGSLITGPDGKVIGSRLIAQPFSGAEYFQPRPSAVSYNAAASGASNWAASNYLLRDRVARQLGPIVRYLGGPKRGQRVADDPDFEKWFKEKPGRVAQWAKDHSGVAAAWVNADDKHKAAVQTWIDQNPAAVIAWKKDNPEGGEPKQADLATAYFEDWSGKHPGEWPKLIDDPAWSLPAVFFDAWLSEHPDADLEQVPADMVMASGSGLDPHITLKNARNQLKDHVAGEWAKRTGAEEAAVSQEIEKLLVEKAEAPLGGLVGVKLVNVLEINQALPERLSRLQRPAR